MTDTCRHFVIGDSCTRPATQTVELKPTETTTYRLRLCATHASQATKLAGFTSRTQLPTTTTGDLS